MDSVIACNAPVIHMHLLFGGAALVTVALAASAAAGSTVYNTMTVTDASGSGETNYPLQFGRPFLDGAIPHAPQVLINGVPATSQADVKNHYPDGSVEYAVMSVVVPSIPANGSVTLTFRDTTTNNNTPLTSAQMLGSNYNFDAQFSLAFPTQLQGGWGKLGTHTYLTAIRAIANGGFNITIGSTPVSVIGLNLSTVTSWRAVATALQAAIGNGVKVELSGGPDQSDAFRIVAPNAASISYASAPASGTDLSSMLGLTQATGAVALAQSTQTASARTMLANSNCKNWTRGPVAQTIICADDTATRAYDIGDGDGYHPFRPRFMPRSGRSPTRFWCARSARTC